MFIDLFYLMRARGLNVSMNEWLSLMDALEKGLCRNSLLEFYYLSRAILIKTEADFDKFDEVFPGLFRPDSAYRGHPPGAHGLAP